MRRRDALGERLADDLGDFGVGGIRLGEHDTVTKRLQFGSNRRQGRSRGRSISLRTRARGGPLAMSSSSSGAAAAIRAASHPAGADRKARSLPGVCPQRSVEIGKRLLRGVPAASGRSSSGQRAQTVRDARGNASTRARRRPHRGGAPQTRTEARLNIHLAMPGRAQSITETGNRPPGRVSPPRAERCEPPRARTEKRLESAACRRKLPLPAAKLQKPPEPRGPSRGRPTTDA